MWHSISGRNGVLLEPGRYRALTSHYQHRLDKSFPYETHRQNLQNVLTVRPRLTVPGSAGFRFFGDHEWLNRFLFPISRELFLDNLKTLDATLEAAIMNPGDVAELTNGEVKIRRKASPFSRTLLRKVGSNLDFGASFARRRVVSACRAFV
jgi:hypothetical protein